MDVFSIILPIIYTLFGLGLIWFIFELVVTIRIVRGEAVSIIKDVKPTLDNIETMVNDIKPALSKVDPLMDRVTLTVDSVNLEMIRVDEILETVTNITSTVNRTTSAINNVTSAPADIITSVTSKLRSKITPKFASDASVRAGLADGAQDQNPIASFADATIDAASEAIKEQQDKAAARKAHQKRVLDQLDQKNEDLANTADRLSNSIIFQADVDAATYGSPHDPEISYSEVVPDSAYSPVDDGSHGTSDGSDVTTDPSTADDAAYDVPEGNDEGHGEAADATESQPSDDAEPEVAAQAGDAEPEIAAQADDAEPEVAAQADDQDAAIEPMGSHETPHDDNPYFEVSDYGTYEISDQGILSADAEDSEYQAFVDQTGYDFESQANETIEDAKEYDEMGYRVDSTPDDDPFGDFSFTMVEGGEEDSLIDFSEQGAADADAYEEMATMQAAGDLDAMAELEDDQGFIPLTKEEIDAMVAEEVIREAIANDMLPNELTDDDIKAMQELMSSMDLGDIFDDYAVQAADAQPAESAPSGTSFVDSQFADQQYAGPQFAEETFGEARFADAQAAGEQFDSLQTNNPRRRRVRLGAQPEGADGSLNGIPISDIKIG